MEKEYKEHRVRIPKKSILERAIYKMKNEHYKETGCQLSIANAITKMCYKFIEFNEDFN